MSSPSPSSPPLEGSALTETRVPGLLAIFIIFTALPLIVVALRLASRRVARLPLWWDDYLVLACVPLVLVQLVFLVEAIQNGMGRHIESLPPQDIQQMVKSYLAWTFASELYYPFIVTFIKSSILMLYIRLFRIHTLFRRICYGLLIFVGCWGVAVLFSTLFQCSPVAAAWDKSIPNAQCFDLRSWLIGTNVPNIMVDVIIIVCPMPLIWQLKLSRPRRIALCGIFFLAFATTVISILRVNANANIDITDPTWSFAPIAEFSTIEGSVGVTCACLPTLAPLFRMCAGKRAVTQNSSTARSRTADPVSSRSTQKRNQRFTHDQSFSQLDDDDVNDLMPQAHHGQRTVVVRSVDAEERHAAVPLDTINVRNDVYVSSGRVR